MPITTGILLALAIVLASAGIGKLAVPRATAPALRAVGLPDGDTVVRGLGLVEVVIAAAVIAFGGPVPAAAMAVAYLAFAVFSAALLRAAGRDASCGCFGQASAPVTGVHVAVNLVAGLVSAAGVVWAPLSLPEGLAELGWASIPFVVCVVTLAWLVRAALTLGAELALAMAQFETSSTADAR